MDQDIKSSKHIDISQEIRDDFYQVLYGRRDVRGQFLPDAIPDEVLTNILHAAHHAPSVGLSQPWNFILIRDSEQRKFIYDAFVEANDEAAQMFEGGRRSHYQSLKL